MKRDYVLKGLTFSFCFLFLFFVFCLFCLNHSFDSVYADNLIDFDKTNVLSDLNGSVIDGRSFALSDYPKSESNEIELVHFVEYGYSHYSNVSSFGLFLYVYNPSSEEVDYNSSENKIRLSLTNDESDKDKYYDYSLLYCNRSIEDGFLGNLIKYKVIDTDNNDYGVTLENFLKQKNERIYNVVSLNLKVGNENVKVPVSSTYTYSGFAKGFGPDINLSTLDCQVKYLETITLNVFPTYYRVEGVSNLGKGHQWQVSSVYFSVPNRYKNEFGNLVKVMAEWYEFKTNSIFVATDISIYNAVHANRYNNVTNNFGYQMWHGYNVDGNSSSMLATLDWSYNIPDEYESSLGTIYSLRSLSRDSNIPIVLKNNEVSSNENALFDYIRNYDTSGYESINVNGYNYNKMLFKNFVDEGRFLGYNKKNIDIEGDVFSLASYNSNHNFFERWRDFGIGTAFSNSDNLEVNYANEKPIVELYKNDINLSDDIFSKQFLVKDSSKIKNFITSSYDSNEIPFLLRFGITDYYSEEVYFRSSGDNAFVNKPKAGYIANESVFLDFEVISLTFRKDRKETVIPVVSNPVNLVSNPSTPIVVNPNKPNFDLGSNLKSFFDDTFSAIRDFFSNMFSKYKVFFIVLFVVIGLLILFPIIKIVVNLILIPFKAGKNIKEAKFNKVIKDPNKKKIPKKVKKYKYKR